MAEKSEFNNKQKCQISLKRKKLRAKITTFTVLGKIRPIDLLSLWGVYESLPHEILTPTVADEAKVLHRGRWIILKQNCFISKSI